MEISERDLKKKFQEQFQPDFSRKFSPLTLFNDSKHRLYPILSCDFRQRKIRICSGLLKIKTALYISDARLFSSVIFVVGI